MNVLCVIPARGGSKGIPGKNLRQILGVPLIGYAIRAARAARMITRVVVSTDDAVIGEAAKRYGAEVVWRPEEISGDLASSESALLHALNAIDEADGYCPDLLVFMQCTSPLTLAVDLDGAVNLLLEKNADVVFSAVRTHAFLWGVDDNGHAVEVNHDRGYRPMRQEMKPQYQETGAFYILRADGFKLAKKRFFRRVILYEVPASRSIDIDDKHDLERAQRLLGQRIEADLETTTTE